MIKINLSGSEKEIVFKISDNGIGIEKGYHIKIFERFFRVPNGNMQNEKGYGLGLSFVAEVVRLHKGKIVVDSVLKEGSVFVLTLPKNLK